MTYKAIIQDGRVCGWDGTVVSVKLISNDKWNCLFSHLFPYLFTYFLRRVVELFGGGVRGITDLCNACTDWLTVNLQFGQMSPIINVADGFLCR